jgi:type IV pilus assembly protein PilA
MKTQQRSAGGFTLVEIMVVTVIIGMLAAIAIPAFYKIRSDARAKAITNNLRQIAGAAQQYILEQGVSEVAETLLEGTTSSNYLRPIQQINGETYSGLIVNSTTTQISTSENDASVVTFNF